MYDDMRKDYELSVLLLCCYEMNGLLEIMLGVGLFNCLRAHKIYAYGITLIYLRLGS